MKKSKFSVEECARLNVTRDLLGTGQVKFDGWSFGQWDGLTWRTMVSANGSFIEIGKTPVGAGSSRLLVRDRGRPVVPAGSNRSRVTSVFMTPDGEVKSRWELSIKNRSQRLWCEKRLAWASARVIESLEGPIEFEWSANIPSTFRRSQSG